MAITADSVTPDPVDVTVEPAPADSTKPKDLQPNTPRLMPGVSVSAKMTPTAAAGVLLARFVLWITAGSIAAFIVYLALMDFTVSSNVNAAYQQVYSVGAVGSEFHSVETIAAISADLQKAKADPNFQLSPERVRNEEDIAAAVAQLPSIPAGQKSTLSSCAPPPTDETRVDVLERCIDLLDRLKSGILAESSSLAHAQAAADAVGKIGEQRQALHAFWIQAAQLVLLNLLLPLLTALFGYIFGTQQSQRENG